MSRPDKLVDLELVEGVRRILLETRSFREAGAWLDQKLASRTAQHHGTRCPRCGQTDCANSDPRPRDDEK